MGNSPPKRAAAPVSELDRFTNPTGLYPSCPWDVRVARRLIVEKRIAPRFPGRESKESCFTQECPICFMFYPGSLNVATCCKKLICTECYLQLKPPKKAVCCPYCNREAFSVKYSAPAVLNISSIYTDSSYMSRSSAESSASSPMAPADLTQHFASAEDRDRLRDDLRSQLNLTDQRLTTPAPRPPVLPPPPPRSSSFIIASAEDVARGVSQPRYIIASAAEAARLEEMMLMEAIRRSMRDLNVDKDDEENASPSSSDPRGSDDTYEGDSDSLRASPPATETPASRRPSSNPFDEFVGDSTTATPAPSRRESANWNPFD